MEKTDKYRLEISSDARYDIMEVYDYFVYILRDIDAANRLIDEITDKINILRKSPKSFARYKNYSNDGFEYRKVPIKKYILQYLIDEENETVVILHFTYGGRNRYYN